MALGGDLKNINLADIFQTLSMNQQVGTLVVRNGIKEKRIFFSGQGVSLSSGRTIPGFRLGKYLLGSGQISHEDLRAALAEQRRTGDLLGKILTTLGLCTKDDVEAVIRYHAAEELYEIFTWKEGEFEFIEGTSGDSLDRPSPYALMQFDAGAIVMEAARRLDEWERFRAIFPADDDFVSRTGKAGESLDVEQWGEDFAGVYALVDGTHSVREVMEEYHLADYDTAVILRDLAHEGLVRQCTLAELTANAWEYLDQHNVAKATKCFERAHAVDPRDASILNQLTQCYERLDEKRAAARCYVSLARLQLEQGMAGEAVGALEKAEKFDPGSEEAPLLLIRAYREHGDLEAVAEKARIAAGILCDKQEFERAVELCREGLADRPGHTGLRIVLANAYLGLGEKEPALDELESIAAALEEARNYRRLEEVYKKILQLDSSRKEYLRRLQELKEGEIRRRRRLLRIGAMAGGGLLLLLLSFFLVTGGTSAAERLDIARQSLRSGDFARAEELADSVLAEEDDDSELWFEATTLKHEIGLKRDRGPETGDGAGAGAELEARIESFFTPASEHLRGDDFPRAIEELVKLADFLESDEGRALRKKAGDKRADEIEDDCRKTVRSMLQAYADHLESLSGSLRGQMTALEDRKVQTMDEENIPEHLESAKGIRDEAEPDLRRRTIDSAEAVEIAVAAKDERVSPRLRKASDALDGIYDRSSRLYHQVRSVVRRSEVREAFEETVSRVADLKNSGRLDLAMAACDEFLRICRKLEDERPEEYYGPVVHDLLGEDGLNLDGKIEVERELLVGVKSSIAAAEALVAEGKYGEANALFRETIRGNYLIDFTDLIRLCVVPRTLPRGARITMMWDEGEPEVVGATGPDGLLVRYRPYGRTVLSAACETFEPTSITIENYNDEHDPSPLLRLKKIPEWTWTGAGPVQASPEVWATTLLVTSRDGHVRGIQRTTGALLFDQDTKLLSGFTARPVVDGSTAYLASLDNRLIALDLAERRILWSVETGERLRTAPLLFGAIVVVADEEGTVYGLRDGEIVWRRALPGRVHGDPVAVVGEVVVGTTEGHLVRLDPATGEVRWEARPGGRVYASLVADGRGRVYVGTDASEVLCIEARDGSLVWRAETDNAVRGRPVLREGRVYASTLAGTVYELAADSGRPLTKVSVPHERGIEGGVAFGSGRLYFVDGGGVLHALSLEEGEDWSFDLGSPALAAPRLHEGFLYVATENGAVYSFRE